MANQAEIFEAMTYLEDVNQKNLFEKLEGLMQLSLGRDLRMECFRIIGLSFMKQQDSIGLDTYFKTMDLRIVESAESARFIYDCLTKVKPVALLTPRDFANTSLVAYYPQTLPSKARRVFEFVASAYTDPYMYFHSYLDLLLKLKKYTGFSASELPTLLPLEFQIFLTEIKNVFDYIKFLKNLVPFAKNDNELFTWLIQTLKVKLHGKFTLGTLAAKDRDTSSEFVFLIKDLLTCNKNVDEIFECVNLPDKEQDDVFETKIKYGETMRLYIRLYLQFLDHLEAQKIYELIKRAGKNSIFAKEEAYGSLYLLRIFIEKLLDLGITADQVSEILINTKGKQDLWIYMQSHEISVCYRWLSILKMEFSRSFEHRPKEIYDHIQTLPVQEKKQALEDLLNEKHFLHCILFKPLDKTQKEKFRGDILKLLAQAMAQQGPEISFQTMEKLELPFKNQDLITFDEENDEENKDNLGVNILWPKNEIPTSVSKHSATTFSSLKDVLPVQTSSSDGKKFVLGQ